ncbi:ubiquinone/menaquinone biosynthesis C-methylase UbiE [Rhodovulum sulfidophilum]|uniref:class I SAM-dependent methyltransferase n=1 Tax=Rhodovulum sulfidophilum TaxID=35806 RepID=UPI0005AA6648|nr:class I SAM-dependent methyltransferase [Rhodovulum sulfidophilum]ANB33172.1 hypothetical protein A6W98_03205 [Rhodovulum sulfidophilum DSM 1374]ANB37020.1 hypothetical protein A6024_03190 [Rhodovulum sulfidophilum]MCW2302404.1 ubiquinone/menaquinone biosynthesis C-methylase UbiE [Rhodovulum sulfidophilum]
MHVNARFWDRLAPRYARMQLRDPEAYEKKLAMTRAWLGPGAQVFEFGCGTGTTALKHAPHAGHVTAIDCAPAMIGIARQKAAEAGIGNVAFRVGDLADMPDSPAAFDMVMAHNVLHLLPDRAEALARVHRMLKPGGVFVSSTACAAGAPRLFRWVLAAGHALRLLPLFNPLTADALRAEIAATGFGIVEDWRPEGGRVPVLFLIAQKPG